MSKEILLQVVAGAIFIALYSYHRFNTPYTNRSCTTALRYHLGATVYSLLIVAVYLGLSGLQVSKSVKGLLTASQEGVQGLLSAPQTDVLQDTVNHTEFLQDPLLLALLLTVLLPQAPWLASLDEWLRDKCKRIAAIPYEVRRLSADLRRSPFELSDETRQAVRRRLLERGFPEEDVELGDGNDPRGLWLKATALMIEVQGWESDPRFAGFLNRFSDEWQRLRAEFSSLVPKAKRCFQLLGDAAAAPQDATISKMADEYQSSLTDEVGRLLEDLYGFISRGVLQCKLTQAARFQQLSQLGFQRSHQPTLSRDSLVAVFLMVMPVIGASLLYGSGGDIREALFRAPQYALTYLVAVICALLASRLKHPSVDMDHTSDDRAWSAYLVAGAAAVTAAVIIGLASKIVTGLWADPMVSPGDSVLAYFGKGHPWLILSFVTAFVTAFHLENRVSERIPVRKLRWIEGATQGVLTLLAGVGVCLWLANSLPEGAKTPWHIVITTGLIGFLLGATVPSWFRATPAEDLEEEKPAPVDPILVPTEG